MLCFCLCLGSASILPQMEGNRVPDQAEFWEKEAMRAREEAATLREALGHRASSASSLARSSYPNSDLDQTFINEDGELILAFEAQKKTLRWVWSNFEGWGQY